MVFTSEGESETASVQSSKLALEVYGNIDATSFFDADELPSSNAVKPISDTLVLGLVTNINYGTAKGYLNRDEHLEYIYAALKKALDAPNDGIHQTTMDIFTQ